MNRFRAFGKLAAALVILVALAAAGIFLLLAFLRHPTQPSVQIEPPSASLLSGRIINESGEAIAAARISAPHIRVNGAIPTVRSDADGSFALPRLKPGDHFLSVSAGGFLTASRHLTFDPGASPIVITLKPDRLLRGKVTDSHGRPVAGVTITLGGIDDATLINDGRLFAIQGRQAPQIATDSDGNYALKLLDENAVLVAVADTGYALVDSKALAASTDVKLLPWGRVTGKVLVGDKPAPDQIIFASIDDRIIPPDEFPQVHFFVNMRTDAGGNFTIERLPAGDTVVYRLFEQHSTGPMVTAEMVQGRAVTIASGATSIVQLGGEGRQVTGRFVIAPSAASQPDWTVDAYSIDQQADISALPLPNPVKSSTPSTQWAWFRDFLLTPPGRLYADAHSHEVETLHSDPVLVDPDGSFHIEDVPPGHYVIHAIVRSMNNRDEFGHAEADFIMPPIMVGQSYQPLQIPDVPITN